MRPTLASFVSILLLVGASRAQEDAVDPFLGSHDLVRNGPSANRVDIVIMGDGFARSNLKTFENRAKDIPRVFERNQTIGEYYRYLNFIRADIVSKDDGIDEQGRVYDTALGAFRKEDADKKGYVWIDTEAVRRMLEKVPEHDGYALVVIKRGAIGSGGNGIATLGGGSEIGVPHLWGHAFANLGDETTVNLLGHRGEETDPINLSKTKDNVPWQHWLDAKVKGVGVYEGGQGDSKGVWRSNTSNCAMGLGELFCRVCQEAMVLKLYRHVDPIDAASPDPGAELTLSGNLEFHVTVMRPKSHELEVKWWLFPEKEAPAPVAIAAGQDRTARGPLPAIEGKPLATTRGGTSGVHKYKLQQKGLLAGRYCLVCRAKDLAKVRNDPWPWVLKDPGNLLESERRWTIVVK